MRRNAILGAIFVLGVVGSAAAQEQTRRAVYWPPNATIGEFARVADGPSYGTSSLSKLTLSPWDFVPIQSGTTYAEQFSPTTIYRTNASGEPWFQAPVHLPSGALVKQVEVQFCNTSTDGFDAQLQIHEIATGTISAVGLVSTVTPGPCTIQTATLVSPITIDNDANEYIIQAVLGFGHPGSNTVRLGAMRVGYQLQVSPAPATATFLDVPVGHPQMRFVEALVAAGITAGCGGGNYCPNAPVTRGQLAVFLASALGLHFPN